MEATRELLSEALDLCVRARKLDELAVCGTTAMWVTDQYEKDLADWERRARAAMAKEGA